MVTPSNLIWFYNHFLCGGFIGGFMILFKMISLTLFIQLLGGAAYGVVSEYEFTKKDVGFLHTLTLKELGEPQKLDFSDPEKDLAAAELGKAVFYDTNFSQNAEVSCATCHNPSMYFTDGKAQASGVGQTEMNAPSVLASAWSPWQFWNGRKDSLWAQALGPLEAAKEHGISRTRAVQLLHVNYGDAYEKAFGRDDNWVWVREHASNKSFEYENLSASERERVDTVFSNLGKAIMAYELKLKIAPSRFDQFVEAIASERWQKAKKIYSHDEVKGLRLFVGKANCVSCHNGPLFSNFEFHNIGVPEFNPKKVHLGRWQGVKDLAGDEFTCLSKYSGKPKEKCLEMKFLKTEGTELVGAFKTPSLRNVAKTAPYMHSGQFATLEEVVNHYNKPKPPFFNREQHPSRPHFDIMPLRLTDEEKQQLVSFLKTLTSPLPENDPWWPVELGQTASK